MTVRQPYRECFTNHVEKTSESIFEARKLLEKHQWSRVEMTAMGAFLVDIYKGIESILRLLIEKIYGEKIMKSESWHKDLLARARVLDLIPDGIDRTIDGMRQYRHLQTHGYSIDLDEAQLRANCPEAIEAFYIYIDHVRKRIPGL
jgi:hypothetical protein